MNDPNGLDRLITAQLEHEAVPRAPEHLLSQVAERAARTRHRPAWATSERWISMETRAQLGAVPRTAIVLAVLGLLLAIFAGAMVAGSVGEGDPPAPFGVAANGLIAYSSGGDIYVVEPDGSGARALTDGPELDDAMHWSRDGRRLAYWSEPAGGEPPYDLRVIDVDGGEPLTIAQAPDAYAAFMTWSADGSEIAYSAKVPGLGEDPCPTPDDSGGMCGFRIFIARTDGSGTRQIGDPDLDARSPELSPDGNTIAFGGGPAASEALYVMDWDGSNVRRLTSDDIAGGQWGFVHSSWSPDGSRIVTQDGGDASDIWVVEADGSAQVNVSDTISGEVIPRYAPGDDAIAWGREGGTWLQDPDAAEAQLLTGFVDFPVWSPDGERLVGPDRTATKFLVIDRAGTILAEIETPNQGFYPSWQRVAP